VKRRAGWLLTRGSMLGAISAGGVQAAQLANVARLRRNQGTTRDCLLAPSSEAADKFEVIAQLLIELLGTPTLLSGSCGNLNLAGHVDQEDHHAGGREEQGQPTRRTAQQARALWQ
jgi:hypothetical protein